jgi:F-type H+-transporting ATPase subunit a
MDLDVHVEIAAETLFNIGPIPVTNSMLTMWIVMAAIILAFWAAARRAKDVPGRFQSVIEMIVGAILGLVEGTAGRRFGRKVLPLILGLFVFILFANLSGLLPGVGTIGTWEEAEHVASEEPTTEITTSETRVGEAAAEEATEHEGEVLVPFFRAPNADLNMTLAMALIAFTAVQIVGIRAHGVGGRIKHMADPPFLFPIEVIGEFSRIISLSARLFGNVFAGEVLLGVMFALGAAIKVAVLPVIFPVIFLFLEVLFGSIQALVFALLTLIYLTLAAASSHGHEDEHAHDDAKAHSAVAAQGSVGD